MKKFKYQKISKTKKLRYIDNYYKKNLYIVFLPGFMSDIEGQKPQSLKRYAIKKKLGFLALEYFGHGKSSGEFTKGNISIWSKNTKLLIKKIIRKNDFIIIGSSMGAWIALNQFKYFKKQIKGFLGIGSAPEFLTRLMWNKFPKKIKKEVINNKPFSFSPVFSFGDSFCVLYKYSHKEPSLRTPENSWVFIENLALNKKRMDLFDMWIEKQLKEIYVKINKTY